MTAMAAARKKIEFTQPKPRVDDWRVKLNGAWIGSVWRVGDDYRVSVRSTVSAPTKEAAFKEARKQLRGLTVA